MGALFKVCPSYQWENESSWSGCFLDLLIWIKSEKSYCTSQFLSSHLIATWKQWLTSTTEYYRRARKYSCTNTYHLYLFIFIITFQPLCYFPIALQSLASSDSLIYSSSEITKLAVRACLQSYQHPPCCPLPTTITTSLYLLSHICKHTLRQAKVPCLHLNWMMYLFHLKRLVLYIMRVGTTCTCSGYLFYVSLWESKLLALLDANILKP